MPRDIALDGPKNGLYIDDVEAAENGYTEKVLWNPATGEHAWQHVTKTDDIPAEFVEDAESYDA